MQAILARNLPLAAPLQYRFVRITAEPSDAGKRLDQMLHERLPQFSRSRLQEWIRNGDVRLNGAAVRPSQVVRPGDRIELEPAAPAPLRAVAEDIPLAVLYEDADVVAID